MENLEAQMCRSIVCAVVLVWKLDKHIPSRVVVHGVRSAFPIILWEVFLTQARSLLPAAMQLVECPGGPVTCYGGGGNNPSNAFYIPTSAEWILSLVGRVQLCQWLKTNETKGR